MRVHHARVLAVVAVVVGLVSLSAPIQAQELTPEEIADLRTRAEQGPAEAQFVLGFLYANGQDGFPQDDAEAAAWYRRAAEQGHPEAQHNLWSMVRQRPRCPTGRGDDVAPPGG